MSPDPPPDEVLAPSQGPGDEDILLPPGEPTFSFDTAPKKSSLSLRMAAELYKGPLPSPAVLRGLAEIYPDAPKVIFDEFKAQASHRRDLEQVVVRNGARASLFGQLIGGLIGIIGILGSVYAIVQGYPVAGATVATSCVVSLVVVFVTGRETQKKERIEKTEIREKMKRGDSVESFQSPPTAGGNDLPVTGSHWEPPPEIEPDKAPPFS